jgi:hypothetical protein
MYVNDDDDDEEDDDDDNNNISLDIFWNKCTICSKQIIPGLKPMTSYIYKVLQSVVALLLMLVMYKSTTCTGF